MLNIKYICDCNGWLNVTHMPSSNYNHRPKNTTISLIVVHNISLPPNICNNHHHAYIHHLFNNELNSRAHAYFAEIAHMQVSAHFLIQRNGQIFQYISVENRAWHAGLSSFNNISNCNDYSIGIELEGSDFQAFTDLQYVQLEHLIVGLKNKYSSIQNIASHSYIAPQRKTDPGPYFYWHKLQKMQRNLQLNIHS
jgi:N-acetyl-anhydromuramoyl-L-alanine amidase